MSNNDINIRYKWMNIEKYYKELYSTIDSFITHLSFIKTDMILKEKTDFYNAFIKDIMVFYNSINYIVSKTFVEYDNILVEMPEKMTIFEYVKMTELISTLKETTYESLSDNGVDSEFYLKMLLVYESINNINVYKNTSVVVSIVNELLVNMKPVKDFDIYLVQPSDISI